MNASLSLKTTLLTAAAALLCTGLQFTGIDSLAAPRAANAQIVHLPLVVVTAQREAADPVIVQLPTVLVTAQREVTAATVVQQLPQVVVVGRRLDSTTATAQAQASAAAI